MRVSFKTDIGLVRSVNQDCFATGKFDDGTTWCVVCDGMGGAAGGDVASSMAVKLISKRIEEYYNSNMKPSSVENLLESAINLANVHIYDYAAENIELQGMGTTVVAAIAAKDVLYISHAGDSRAYCCSEDELTQLTVDHSLVQEMVNRGELTEEEAEHHPIKNYITRALGVDDSIAVDFSYFDFYENDVLMVCTDGLTNCVSKEKIYETLMSDIEDKSEKLVECALDGGGKDNITVVVIENKD